MTPTCPCCGGDGAHLGTLGNLDWFRCVGCGSEFSTEAQPTDDDLDLMCEAYDGLADSCAGDL